MKPSKHFLKAVRVTRACASVCGTDVLDKNYKINHITIFVVLLLLIYFAFTPYTIMLKFTESWTIVLEALCMIGTAFQATAKLASALYYAKSLRGQIDMLKSIYQNYEAKGADYRLVLNNRSLFLLKLLKGVALGYMLTVLTMVSSPFVILAFTNRRTFAMQYYLPFLDPSTNFGYFATNSVHICAISLGSFGIFAGDMLVLIIYSQTIVFLDIFKLKVQEINVAIERCSSDQRVWQQLVDIITWHQAYVKYLQTSQVNFFWVNFTQVTTSGASIVLTIVVIFIGDWLASYFYAFLCFSLLFLYCGLGTFVNVINHKITNEIYAIYWYKMTVSQRRCVLFMLKNSQAVRDLTVGVMIPLSVNTALQISKTIYTVLMLLLQRF